MKKVLITWGIIYAVLLVLVLICYAIFGGNSVTSPDGIKFWLNKDGTAEVTGYVGSSDVISIPESYDGHTVTVIEEYAFSKGCSFVKRIEIPSTVHTLYGSSFDECTMLEEFYVAEDNAHYRAVAGDLLSKDGETLVRYPCGKGYPLYQVSDGIIKIGKYAFSGVHDLRSVVLSDTVEEICSSAFYNCSRLAEIELGASVSKINPSAFSRAAFITEFSVDRENPHLCSIDGNIYSKDETTLYFYAVGKNDESFTVPDTVTEIGENAFYEARYLLSVTLPDGLESIDERAFGGCDRLTELTLPMTLRRIGQSAFAGSYNLDVVRFQSVVGWRAEHDYTKESITLSEEELKDPSVAAEYLTNRYDYYTWTKE